MAEHSHQPLPEIVSKCVAAIAEVDPKKKRLVTQTKIQGRIEELEQNIPKNKTETRGNREKREAKEFVDQVQANQENITAVMKEWNEVNKYKNVLPLNKAQEKLKTAWKLSKDPPTWTGIASADGVKYSAITAEYLSTLAMLPKDLAQDPNVVFQLTAKFAASINGTGEARAEEIFVLDKSILHIRELRDLNKTAGFTLNNEDLTYTLRGAVLHDEILDPISDNHTKLFLSKFQKEIDNRGSISTEQKLREWNDMGKLLTKAISVELDARGNKKTFEIEIKDLTKYINRVNRRVAELEIQNNQEKTVKHKENSLHIRYEDIRGGIPADERTHDVERKDDIFTFRSDAFTPENIKILIEEGSEGEDAIFFSFIEKIDGLGKSHERASIPEQYFWDEFERYMEWKYKENVKAHLGPYEYVWKEHERLSMVIKNLLYQPGDLKDKIKNLQFLTQADFDHFVHNYKWGGDAAQLYEEVIFDLLSDRRAKYDKALSELTTPGTNGKKQIEVYQDLMQWRKKGSVVSNDEIEVLKGKKINQLTSAEIEGAKNEIIANKNKEISVLQDKIDTVGSGVMLWDNDIQNNTEVQFEIVKMKQELDKLQIKKDNGDLLTDYEKEQLKTLEERITYKRSVILKRENASDVKNINKEAHDTSELSAIDVEVRSRLLLLLKSRGINVEEIPEWQIRRAIWASRQGIIGSGRIMSICSTLVTRPAYELKDLYKVDIGKYVMRSPAFEDLQRIINPDMFQDRFGTASEAGAIFRATTTVGFLEQKGFKFRNDERYKRQIEKDLDPEVRKSREFLRQVREETGIPYTETIVQGLFQGGGMFDKSLWRGELTVVDAIRKHRESMGLPPDAQLENQALGIRIALANTPEEKRLLIEKLVERNPGKLMQLLGEPLDRIMTAHGFAHDSEKTKILKRALSLSTVIVSQKREFITKDVRLMSNEADFNLIIKPLLLDQKMSEADITTSFKILKELKQEFTKTRKDMQYSSMLDAWAHTELPLTITMSDINWEEVDFSMMGTAGPDRRGRDLFNMSQARDAWMKLEDPALLCNKDTKEVLKIIKEFRSAMNNYTSPRAAEDLTYELVKSWIEFNRNKRTKHIYDPTAWIPLVGTVMKNAGFINWGALDKIAHGLKLTKNNHAIQEWMREKVTGNWSYAARFTGPKGNAWEEKEIDQVLDALLGMGIFNNNEASYVRLRREKRAGIGRQFFGLVRKNWWLVPLITVLMSAKTSLDEEKKK